MPDRCWTKLSAVRSPARSARASPFIRASTVAEAAWSPSCTRGSSTASGSRRRNTASATSSPATTTSSRVVSAASSSASSGITAWPVMSPTTFQASPFLPKSSTRAVSIRRSMSVGSGVTPRWRGGRRRVWVPACRCWPLPVGRVPSCSPAASWRRCAGCWGFLPAAPY